MLKLSELQRSRLSTISYKRLKQAAKFSKLAQRKSVKVFISWSGELSRELGEALRDWLPAVLQSVKPFFTPNDIEKGARWAKDISQELQESAVGIFCLTKENLTKPWIMFEAGALSKQLDTSRVCPVLFGVENAELEGPLVQFQASPFSEVEMRKLVRTLNSGLGDQRLEESVLSSVFEMWWPQLNDKVAKILERHKAAGGNRVATRTDRDILEEVLELSRLGAASSTKLSRRGLAVEPDALLHCLKHLLILSELVGPVISEKMESTLGEVFRPLKYIVEQSNFGPKTAEFEEVIGKIGAEMGGKL